MENISENVISLESLAEAVNEEKKDKLTTIDFKMVAFSLAGKDYAIDIMKVKEIAKAGRFTYVPNTDPYVLGVYNLRGDIISIIDLRTFFNIDVPERTGKEIEKMIIVGVGDQSYGVVIDAIDKVVGIQKSTIQPPHPLFQKSWDGGMFTTVFHRLFFKQHSVSVWELRRSTAVV